MLVDIVDIRNTPVATAPRSEVLTSGLNFRTVHVLLTLPDGRLILQRLPKDHARSPDRLGSSVAGYLAAGEDYGTAARRRLSEELGVAVDLEPAGVMEMADLASTKFVGVFLGTVPGLPEGFDRGLIAALEAWSPRDVEAALASTPGMFTATFAHVFAWFRNTTRSEV